MLPTYKKASKTMTFTCERCRRDFRDKTDLTRHQNRKKPCQPANPMPVNPRGGRERPRFMGACLGKRDVDVLGACWDSVDFRHAR